MAGPTVIKMGGALVQRSDALDALWSSVARMATSRRVVVVHGGGPAANDLARRLQHEPQMVHGRRVTTALDLQIVQWTMRGELNTQLAASARRAGIRAVGLSGVDGGILKVIKRPPWVVDGRSVDFGWVGDVDAVDADLLNVLMDGGYVPIVAPLGIDENGQVYNVNADTVSSALAAALGADEYLLVTDSGGVRRDADDPKSHIRVCTADDYQSGISEGWIKEGMHVKLKVAFDALRSGVGAVYILSPDDIDSPSAGTRVVESNT